MRNKTDQQARSEAVEHARKVKAKTGRGQIVLYDTKSSVADPYAVADATDAGAFKRGNRFQVIETI